MSDHNISIRFIKHRYRSLPLARYDQNRADFKILKSDNDITDFNVTPKFLFIGQESLFNLFIGY